MIRITRGNPAWKVLGRRQTGPVTARVQCCIAGGGPAGMMLGLLLARAGVRVLVLEKHRDFLRDFRGDTIHPSTLELLHELGLLEAFLRLPHQEVSEIRAQIGDTLLPVADFSSLPVRCPFIAMIPQWDFLDFLARSAARFPGFALRTQAEVTDLVLENGRVAGLRLIELGAPIDVLWFRLSRQPGDPQTTMGRFDRGSVAVMLDRGDYWQCAFVIGKGFARGTARARPRVVERPSVPRARFSAAAHDGARDLGRTQAPRRAGQPAGAMGVRGAAVHRRRGACLVPRRRGRHQPRDPGRGGGGQPPAR